ncbi:hypothetical protein C8F01DRAFT_1189567, partial [Mycena amicta]
SSASCLTLISSFSPKKFSQSPLGSLMVQTNGLAGHEHEFYHYVSQTDWTGGTSAYSSLEEGICAITFPSRGSYWFVR